MGHFPIVFSRICSEQTVVHGVADLYKAPRDDFLKPLFVHELVEQRIGADEDSFMPT